ncbi:MAG: UDP-N-acetylglucosamine 2-epimerase (non-hydrolyzing) [Candidatus Helarchaeota archaeon]|nr:UDP-N-acetylglucosamine 2-epimerase (non-hydrolyzing) [Candidatus Helarchaeota archaeon]
MEIAIILGTRPEIIKMAPIIRHCEKEKLNYSIIHTEQHYDSELSNQFFKDLKIRKPDYSLNVGSGSHGAQTGQALIKIEEVLMEINPSIVLVQGDTNTALSGALAAVKLHLPIGHVEAGLRSYDLRMPEEHNRRLIDHMSNYLFAPTKETLKILQNENVWGESFITGNTVIDACMQHYALAKETSTIQKSLKFKDFVLCTVHRTENIDDSEVLQEIVQILVDFPDNIILPIHPHTKNQLELNELIPNLKGDHIQIIPPVGYLDLLWMLRECKYVLSDSGGIQEEATAPVFNKFVFVLREKTDRREAVESGFAVVTGTDSKKVLEKIRSIREKIQNLPKRPSPYGKGNAAQNIIEIIKSKLK